MSELALWHQANDQYLSDALAWLRSRLQWLAEHDVVSAADGVAGSEEFLPPPPPPALWENTREPQPAMVLLGQCFGLTAFERGVLLLCAAMEFDTRTASLCARVQRDSGKAYPTFALALMLFDDPAWEVISPARPLRYWRLIEIDQPGAQPLTTSALRADERIVNYIKGLNDLDDRLVPLLAPLAETDPANDLPLSQQQHAETIITHLRRAGHRLPVVHLLGPDTASKRSVAAHVAQSFGLSVYRLSTDLLPGAWGELETLARLYQRESYLLPTALYLDTADSGKELPAINHLLARLSGLVFLDTGEAWPKLGRDALTFHVAKPSLAEQKQAWRHALGEQAGPAPALLASQFNLNLAEIQYIAKVASSTHACAATSTNQLPSITESVFGCRPGNTPAGDEPPILEPVWNACLVAARPRLDTLAQRLDVRNQAWDDLVLPETEKNLLRQIMDQVGQRHVVYDRWGFNRRMSRGLGINALFAGESGTGKTLAAEVIAHELKLNLYRIDLSQVVSKYIGETEKNLRQLFDAAEDGGTMLFFDEADALFGKRSEVKDSHDRYANIEINYLLQRMESYRGLAILATNMKAALDQAFMRRLRFIVNFPFPGVDQRKRIWQRAFPKETEKEELDYDRLARFNLTGGSIQNIAVNAAFLAASAGSAVRMPLIFDAVRTEFRKLEKPLNESEFRLVQVLETQA